MMKVIKEILFWTWCLPQTLLGFILSKIYKAQKHIAIFPSKGYDVKYYLSGSFNGGISLGRYIITGLVSNDDETIQHEYGHQLQSFILGPLYLLVIGLPSLIWCNILQEYVNKKRIKKGKKPLRYYWFYTESWANKLVGIK